MSATNSRIAYLRRIRLDFIEGYWNRKANFTVYEYNHYMQTLEHLDELIELEKLRTVDYLKAS